MSIPELSFGRFKPRANSYRCKLRIVFEDDDGRLQIVTPSSRWMIGCMVQHRCAEIEALCMLAAKLVEQGILPESLTRKGNRPRTAVTHESLIPDDERFRDAWRLENVFEENAT